MLRVPGGGLKWDTGSCLKPECRRRHSATYDDRRIASSHGAPNLILIRFPQHHYNRNTNATEERSRFRPCFTQSLRSEEHTSELQSLMRISYAVFCLKKKKKENNKYTTTPTTLHQQLH